MPKTRIPAKHAKYQTNSRLRMLKLEQRILFDGAAAVEVAAAAAQDNSAPDAAPRPSPSMTDAPAITANPSDASPALVDVATAQDTAAQEAVSGQKSAPVNLNDTATKAAVPANDAATGEVGTPGTTETSTTPTILLVVDSRVENYQSLLADLPASVMVRVVNAGESGLDAITQAIASEGPGKLFDAIQIISHGSSGSVTLGADILDKATLNNQAILIQAWSQNLSANADILLYGCDVGAGADGSALLTQLALLTNADIAASIDATGSAAKGGDWILEAQTGRIDSQLAVSTAALAAYDSLLAAPVNTVPVAQTVAEDNTIVFGVGKSISIADTDGTVQSVTVGVAHGTLTLASTTGLTLAGNGTASIAITAGSIANINAALNGLVYRPAANYAGADSLTIVTNDGSATDTDSVVITVTPNATAPVLTLPVTAQAVREDVPTFLDFTASNAIVLTDADANDLQTLNLSVAHGTLNINPTVGASISSGNGTNSVIVSGTAAQLSATLASATGVQYRSALNYNGSEALSFSLSDGVLAHNQSGVVSLNVTPVNDAPSIAGGSPLSVPEGGSASFSAAVIAGSGFSQSQLGLSDVDTSAIQATVKIAGLPTHGVLKLNGNPVAIGSTLAVSDINKLSYTQDGSQVTSAGTDTFVLTFDDGAGGLLSNQTVTVNLTPVNQAPSVSGAITVIEGETNVRLDLNGALPTLGTPRGAISVSDAEGAVISSYTITSLPTNGTLYYNGVAISAASLSSPFTVADKTLLTYSHNGSETTADSFNVSVTDNGGGTGTPATSSGTISLVIYPNDDDPTLANDVTQTLGVSRLTITEAMLKVVDVDSSAASLTYTLNSVPDVAQGYFSLNGTTLVAGTSFTQADIAAGLLVYVSRSNTPRTDSISFTVKDSGQRIYPTLRDGGIYTAGTDTLKVNTFNIVVPSTAPIDSTSPPAFALVNAAPITGGSNSVTLLEGETATLTSAMLGATDADDSTGELLYRLHSLPSSGSVRLNGTALLINQTFTQADVNNGRVSFSHGGGEDFIDAFSYTVSDGKTVTALKTFNIATTPQNDTPSASVTGQLVAEGGSFAVTTAHIVLADSDNSSSDNETGYAVNNALSFTITGIPTHGTLKLSGVNVTDGTVVTSLQLANGNLVYAHDGSENFSDSFKLTPMDDKGITLGMATATNQVSIGAEVSVPIMIYGLNDAPSFVSKLDLTGTLAIQEGATATIGGASSYAVINGVIGSGVPTPVAGAHLVFGDNDNSSVQRQFRVTATTVNGQLMLNGATLGAGSVFTQADLDSGRITYKHNGSETSTDAFSYVVSDGDWMVNESQVFAQGTAPTPSSFQIQITPRNDAPTLVAPANLDAFAANAATTPIPGVTLADIDLTDGVSTGESDFVRVEVQVLDTANALVGTAQLSYGAVDPSGGSAFLSGKGSSSLIVQGSKAQIDAVLASLTIAFSGDADASNYKIRVTADDRLYSSAGVLTSGANGGPGPINADSTAMDATNNRITRDIALRASNFNDLPTITNTSTYSVNEDAQVTLSGFGVADVDSFGNDVTATVNLYSDASRTALANAATQGALLLGATTGLTSFTGNNTNTITLTGSLANVQAALSALKFAGAANYNGVGVGSSSLYLRTTIADFSHADGQKTAAVDNTITIVPVNDVPTLTVPATQTLLSGTTIAIGGFGLGDVADIGQGAIDYVEVTVAATLSGVAYGTIDLTASGGATLTGDLTSTVVLRGSTADVQATLNSMVYTPGNANADGTVVITTTVDDRSAGVGNGKEGISGVDGNNTAVRAFNINISNINDAPAISAPAAVTATEDVLFLFNSANLISIADSDDFGAAEKVTLDLGLAPKGTLTMTTLTGLTFTTGDGTTDTKMVFTGTKAAINTALATLRFTPNTNINTVGAGNAQSLSITVDDQGNTGANGALTNVKTVAININPVNDAPTRSSATAVTLAAVAEDATPAGNTIALLFGPSFTDAADTQAGGSSANAFAGVAVVANAATAAQGKWQYDSGSGWTDLPTATSLAAPFLLKTTDLVRFLPTGNWNGTPGQLTVRLIDTSSGAVTTGAGPNLSAGAATGGTTAYSNAGNSVALGTSVTAVNDAPIASGTVTVPAINEDTTNPPGSLVSALVGAANYSDATDAVAGGSVATLLGGIAIVGNTADATTQGVWRYTTNGGTTWTTVPTTGLGDASALVLPAAAQLRFEPVANYNGAPGGLSIRLADSPRVFSASSDISSAIGGTGTWSAALVPLGTTVNPVNDAPTLSNAASTRSYTENAAAVTLEGALSLGDVDDTQLNQAVVAIGAGFVAGDRLNFTNQSGISGSYNATTGTLTLTGTATLTDYQAALRSVSFDSTSDNPGSGTRSISWTVRDVNAGAAANGQQTSLAGSTSMNVTPVNDAPVAVADSATVTEGGTVTVLTGGATSVLTNDTDAEGNPLTAILVSGPANGTLTLNADGTFSYTHNGGETTSDSFTYKVNDGTVDGNTVTVAINVTPVNDAPVAVADSATVAEGGTVTVLTGGAASVLTNDTDAEGNPLTAILVSGPANGTLTLNADGTFSYTHNGGETTSDSFTYKVNDGTVDGNTVTVAINVTPVNDAPVAVADSATVTEGGTVTVLTGGATSVLTNDTDAEGNPLTAILVSGPANGTLTLNADGTFSYTHNGGETTSDSFTYKVNDGTVDGNTVTVAINVTPVNDAPVAVADSATVAEGGTVTVLTGGATSVLTNDTDAEGNPLTAILVSGPANGTLTLNADGTFSYTHNGGETTSDSFTYKVNDGTVDGNTVTVAINVTPVNDAPVAVADSATVAEGGTVTVLTGGATSVLTNDTDAEGNPLTAILVSGPANGTLTLNADGTFSYTHNGGETTSDSFTYKVNDGTVDGNTVTVAINVTPVNDAPVAVADSATVTEGGTVTVLTGGATSVLTNDTDAEGNPLTAILVSGPANGTLTLNADGTFSYTHNGGETTSDSFTYKVNDGTVDGNTVTVAINVTPVNDAPVAVADSATVTEGGTVTVLTGGATSVLTNDTDAEGNPLTAILVSGPANGTLTLNADGTFSYTHNGGETTSDSFTYKVNDGTVDGNTVTVAINVTPVNDAPVAVADTLTATEDTAVTYNTAQLLGNDTDVDNTNAQLSIASVTSGVGGTAVLNANGTVTFTPNANFNGVADFTYTVTDGNLTSNTATVTVTVAPVNDAPDVVDATVTLNENVVPGTAVTNVSDSFTGTDFDRDGQAITYSITAGNTDGIFVIDPATGAITIAAGKTLDYETAVQHVLTVRASDGTLSDTAQITVNVTDLDDTAPTASIVVADTSLSAGETSLVTITFSEAVIGFTNPDLAIENGTLSDVSTSDGGKTWTATFTPTANITDTTNVITLNNTGVSDLAGNAGTGTTHSNNYAIDTLRPMIAIGSDKAILRAEETATLTFTLSEPVADFVASDISVSGGTLSNFTGSGTRYTATFTPASSSTSAGVISVASNMFTDAAGNANNDGADADNRVNLVIDTMIAQPNSPANYQQLAPTTVSFTSHAESFQPANYVLAAVADGVEQVNRTGEFSPDTSRTSPIMAALSTDISLHVLRAVRAVGSDVRAVTNTIATITANSLSSNARNSLLGVGAGGPDQASGVIEGTPAPADAPDSAAPADAQAAPIADVAQDSPVAGALESQPVARTTFSEQLRRAAENRRLNASSQRRSA